MFGCAKPEDPGRVSLRMRLKEPRLLESEEIGRTLDEVGRAIAGKTVMMKPDDVAQALNAEQRDVVLGMLVNRIGLYDEGLRSEGGAAVRVLNAPGISSNPEYSAARKLWIDVETFRPRRFEFAYEFPGMGDYEFDLVIGP
jgi:hypothetical protein